MSLESVGSEETGAVGVQGGGRWRGAVLVACLLLVLSTRFATIYTDNVNWDEFGLLHHASWTSETGVLHGAGRPGLAVVLLLPLLGDCPDEMTVVHRARAVWLFFTGALLAGLFVLVARLRRDASSRFREAGLAVALLALVPAFLQWSIEVRTDQLALAAGLWGGVALLGSRDRTWLAALAGALFAVGYLSTPKVVYVCGLVGLLAAGDLWLRGELALRREAIRASLGLLAGALVVALFHAAVAALENPQGAPARGEGLSLAHGFSVFEFYRNTIGYSEYAALAPWLLPHAGLAIWVGLAVSDARCRRAGGRQLALAAAVLALGALVAGFHAAAFGYFWMTVGLFPAVALALAWGPTRPLLDRLTPGRRFALVACFWSVLGAQSVLQSALLLRDTQSVQRSTMEFVRRNFEGQQAGFQPEGALFCRAGERPLPVFYSQLLYQMYGADPARAERSVRWLLGHFESRQIRFLVESWRLQQFPEPIREFWRKNYLPYRDAVWVAGRRFDGTESSRDFDLVVDGEYRWVPLAGPTPVAIDGRELAAGQVVTLSRGPHTASFGAARGPGVLVLAVREPPQGEGRRFYKYY